MLFNEIVVTDQTLLLKRGVTSSIIEIPNDEYRAVLLPWSTVANIQRVGDRGQIKTTHGSGFDFDAKLLWDELCVAFAIYLDGVEIDLLGPDAGD